MVTTAPRMVEADRAAISRAGLGGYRFIEAIAALPFVEAIWLYGSRARGQHRERSDIDLAVDAPTATAEQWQRVLNLVDDADTLLQIDCVRLDALPEDDPLRRNILAEGRLLIARDRRER